MNIKYIVLCRYNSSRLPGKILKEINGTPLLEIMLKRLQTKIAKEDIIIATSTEATDHPIEQYCVSNDYNIYRGNLENVSKRFLDCAEKYSAEYAVRINGDNIFTDAGLILEMVNFLVEKPYQFISNVPERTFPFGLSVEIVNVPFYKSLTPIINENERYKEHVTLLLYEHPELLQHYLFYKNEDNPEAYGVQLAVDTAEDFNMVTSIVKTLDKEVYTTDWKKILAIKNRIHE